MLLTPAHQTIGETTMSVKTEILGGRLPLLDPQALSIGQKDIYDRLNTTMIPWADGAHFQSKTDDGRLIGPFNPILFSPDISARFLDLHDGEEKHTSLNNLTPPVLIPPSSTLCTPDSTLYVHTATTHD